MIPLFRIRKICNDNSATCSKVKKWAGFAIASVFIAVCVNYSYLVYRYANPVNPYSLIGVNPNVICPNVKVMDGTG